MKSYFLHTQALCEPVAVLYERFPFYIVFRTEVDTTRWSTPPSPGHESSIEVTTRNWK